MWGGWCPMKNLMCKVRLASFCPRTWDCNIWKTASMQLVNSVDSRLINNLWVTMIGHCPPHVYLTSCTWIFPPGFCFCVLQANHKLEVGTAWDKTSTERWELQATWSQAMAWESDCLERFLSSLRWDQMKLNSLRQFQVHVNYYTSSSIHLAFQLSPNIEYIIPFPCRYNCLRAAQCFFI